MATIKVKAWGKGQGDFVLIDADDFDPKIHAHYDGQETKKPEVKQKPKVKAPE